ncbi:MAG: thiamine-phosphate kinase [Nitrososphaerales archaeon]|jgi:thiamine-monophosphate kinase
MPDERRIIESIVGTARKVPAGYSRIGDDVAVVPARGKKVVLKVDMLVESTDVPPGMSYRQAARKAVAMCVSDFAAKGVRPDSFMVSLGLRRRTTKEQVDQLARGFRDAEREWDVRMVGGDTNEAGQLVIDCTMVGFAKKVVERRGARPGDALVVTGPFGYSPAGLKIMIGGAKADRGFRETATRSVTKPTPDLEVGIALGDYLTSAMDSSDGLARSIHTLAEESGVGFELDKMPAGEGVAEFAKDNNLSLQDLVMAGGEEYVIVGTISPRKLASAKKAARLAGGQITTIGKATRERGRVFVRAGQHRRRIPDEGWTHLR